MRQFRITIASIALSLAAIMATAYPAPASASGSVTLSAYAPFPKATLTTFGVTFGRPTRARVSGLAVSPSRALAIASTEFGPVSPRAKVTVRLGVFSNKWTHPAISKVIAYAVILDGVVVPSYGPDSTPVGHELVVIVNAHSGHVYGAFSYR